MPEHEELSPAVAALLKDEPADTAGEAAAKADTKAGDAPADQSGGADAKQPLAAGDDAEQGGESKGLKEDKPAASEKVAGDDSLTDIRDSLSNLTDHIAELTKASQKSGPTEAQQAKIEKAKQRVAKIREYIADHQGADPYDQLPAIAEQLLDIDEQLGAYSGVNDRVQQLEARLARYEADAQWRDLQVKYPGADLNGIWQKAIEEARADIGDDDQGKLHRLASKYFHTRAQGASTRKNAPAPKVEEESPKKGGASVTVQTELAAKGEQTEDDRYMQNVMKLLKPDEK
jgi:hypothetical protein